LISLLSTINSIKGGLFVKPLLYKDLRPIFMPFVPDTFIDL